MDEIQWELREGDGVRGPFTEAALVLAIEQGLPATTQVRPVGREKWKPVGAHMPFSEALARAAQRIAVASAPIAAPPFAHPPPPPFSPPTPPRAVSGTSGRVWLVAGGVGCLCVALLVAVSAMRRGPSDADFAAEEASAKARALAAVNARKQKEEAAAHADDEANRRKAAQVKAALQQAHDLYAGMTPAGREAALREACEAGCDRAKRGAILGAADDTRERDKLRDLAERLDAAYGPKSRESYAESLADAYLARHMNPDGVSVAGQGKTILVVRGAFCSRQFLHDFREGNDGKSAVDYGFKQIQCVSPLETWTGDL